MTVCLIELIDCFPDEAGEEPTLKDARQAPGQSSATANALRRLHGFVRPRGWTS